MKINSIYSIIEKDILSGTIGKSGDLFFTTEELMEKYSVSYITALKLAKMLIDNKFLISIGNKKFIMNGLYQKNSALYSHIDAPRKKIGVVIQDITNPFFASITNSLNSLIMENGFTPVIKISDKSNESDILISFIQEGCQGIVSFFQNNTPYMKDVYGRLPVPVVFISDDVPTEKHCIVNSDNLRSGYLAAKHLTECGYSSLYFCGLSKNLNNPRAQGFLDFIKEKGLPFNDSHVIYFDISNPYRNHYVIKTILNDTADRIGVFCFHDLIAEYLYNLCTLNDIAVPNKVGIIGYDKLDAMMPSNINLTTFSYSFKNIANSALKLLMENMNTLISRKKIISENTFLSIGKTTAKL
nr:LacI family DNA-binding transcriptional regulator [Clostridia bacterium]